MANTAVPTLTSEGWITAVDKKCDRLLMNAFASDKSQSNMFQGVTSIQAIIYENSDNVDKAGVEIASALQVMFGHHFDAAIFSSNVTEFAEGNGRYDVSITGTVIQEMRKYDFGRMVKSVNGIVVELLTAQGDTLWKNASLNM